MNCRCLKLKDPLEIERHRQPTQRDIIQMDKANRDLSYLSVNGPTTQDKQHSLSLIIIYGLSDTEDMLKGLGSTITASMSLSVGYKKFKMGMGRAQGKGSVCQIYNFFFQKKMKVKMQHVSENATCIG